MIEELGNARAYYSLQCHDTQDALQQLLNERHELRTNLLEAYKYVNLLVMFSDSMLTWLFHLMHFSILLNHNNNKTSLWVWRKMRNALFHVDMLPQLRPTYFATSSLDITITSNCKGCVWGGCILYWLGLKHFTALSGLYCKGIRPLVVLVSGIWF